MKKKRLFSGLLIVLAILSVLAYAKIFLFPDNLFQIVKAQPAPFVYVYLESPQPGSTLSGQYNFDINIVFGDSITSLIVRVLSGTDDIGEMPCSLTKNSDSHWRGPCDTLFIPPHLQSVCFEIQAYGVDGRIDLEGGDCGQARFGPFSINNSFTITQPAANSEVSGTVPLAAAVSGDASSALFDIVGANTDQPSQQITARKDSGDQGHSTWSATWETSSVPNGDYTINFSFVTLGGIARTDVASVVVHVVNQACVPSWQCGSWSDCSSAGRQTRSCTDGCGNSQTEEQSCSNAPPENSNLNTNTVPPSNSNSNTNAPLAAPAITGPADGSQLRASQPTVTGTASVSMPVRIYLNNTLNGQTNPQSNGTFSYQLASPLAAGSYELFAVSTDGSQTSPESTRVHFDILPPRVVMTIPTEGQTIAGSVTLTARVGEGEIGSMDFYREVRGAPNRGYLIGAGRPLASNQNVWERSWDTSDVDNGQYVIYARFRDRAGNYYLTNRVQITINHQLEVSEAPPATTSTDDNTDTDLDGVPDLIEQELGTNPNNPDSNNNGIPDDQEVSLMAISADKLAQIRADLASVAFEEPTTSGVAAPEKLKILTIENFSPAIGQNALVFRGVGPANSTLTIFIYSSPIVVTTKTDASGNFTYTLDKNLLDGKHEVYVTVTDETGKIQEKSSPFTFFIRRAQAVSEEDFLRGDVNVQGESATLINNYLIVAVVIIAVVLIILLVAYYVSRRAAKIT